MKNLISEIILDPTNTTVLIESGDTIMPIGIDVESDYPTTRILRIYNKLSSAAPHDAMRIAISNKKFSIVDGLAFYELVDFCCIDNEISFSLVMDSCAEKIDLFLYTSNPVVLLKENFVFLNLMRDLVVIDSNNEVLKLIENPNQDDESNELSITYSATSQSDETEFYITNFLNKYRKPLFVSSLDGCEIDFS
jgi:hypothetical protein